MEKKIRYLMLLLCLCLFPMKAFALEGELEDKNKEVDNVVVENASNTENLIDEDLVKVTNSDDLLLEDDNSNDEEDSLVSTDSPTEGSTTLVEEKKMVTTKNVENLESDNEEPGNEVNANVDTEVNEITLTGINTDLVLGAVTFTGTSGESEKYTLVRQEWETYNEKNETIKVTSDETVNQSLQAEGKLITSIEECVYYNYNAILKFADGFYPADRMTVYINGTQYRAFLWEYDADENIATIYVVMDIQARNENAEYLESIEFENVVTDAVVGQEPTYGATTPTAHFTIVGERWEYFVEIENANGF